METTRLSTKGQVIIPKPLREALRWRPGQELEVIGTKEGLLLKARAPFEATRLQDVAGLLRRAGPALGEDEIKARLRTAARQRWRDRR